MESLILMYLKKIFPKNFQDKRVKAKITSSSGGSGSNYEIAAPTSLVITSAEQP